MKYEQIIHTLPRLLTARQAEDYVASPTAMTILIQEHGLDPVIKRNGLTLYDRLEIDLAIEKLKQRRG